MAKKGNSTGPWRPESRLRGLEEPAEPKNPEPAPELTAKSRSGGLSVNGGRHRPPGKNRLAVPARRLPPAGSKQGGTAEEQALSSLKGRKSFIFYLLEVAS